MREEIERVIVELEDEVRQADKNASEAAAEGSLYREGIHDGRGRAFTTAINLLKEVLANEKNNSTT